MTKGGVGDYVQVETCDEGPVSQKPRKPFGPVKPFLVHLYLKTEKCIRLKLLV